jgi:agmatine/peptidylarginine deiminase
MLEPDHSPVEHLIVIYPEGVSEDNRDYSMLGPFYDELLGLVPEDVHVIALVQTSSIGSRLKALRKNLDYEVHGELLTIWLRDVAGFNCRDRIVKPIFRPRYYRGAFDRASRIDWNMRCISEILGKKLIHIPLIWDGGNLVSNGKVGLITERLLQDNPTFSMEEITEIIRNYLGIEPIFIPELEGDALAHSDGYIAFVDERTAVVSEYPISCSEKERNYVNRIGDLLTELEFMVVRIQENPVHDDKHEDFQTFVPSAAGIYVNYLRLNETIILPEYSHQEPVGDLDHNALNRSIMGQFGRVLTINCDLLAKEGGILHCISITD